MALRYLCETTYENAYSPSLEKVQTCIDKIKQDPTVRRKYMDLKEFIDRERREAAAEAAEENKKVTEELKKTIDKTTAELDQAKAEQHNFQKLTSILLKENLVDELKRAAEDENYKESLYVKFGVKPAQV